jgi:hypothetical protein
MRLVSANYCLHALRIMWRFIGSKFIASLQFRPNWRKIQIHPHLPKLQASPYRKVQILNLF